eukprot:314322_1
MGAAKSKLKKKRAKKQLGNGEANKENTQPQNTNDEIQTTRPIVEPLNKSSTEPEQKQDLEKHNKQIDEYVKKQLEYDKSKCIEYIINVWFKNDKFQLIDENIIKIIFNYYFGYILFYYQEHNIYEEDEIYGKLETIDNYDEDYNIIVVHTNGNIYRTDKLLKRIPIDLPIDKAFGANDESLFTKHEINITKQQIQKLIAYLLYINSLQIKGKVTESNLESFEEEQWIAFRYNSQIISVFNILYGCNGNRNKMTDKNLDYVFKDLFAFIEKEIKMSLTSTLDDEWTTTSTTYIPIKCE